MINSEKHTFPKEEGMDESSSLESSDNPKDWSLPLFSLSSISQMDKGQDFERNFESKK